MTKFLKNADVTGYISQTLVTSSLLKTDSSGKLVAATAGTDYQAPTAALLPTGGTAGQILAKIDATNYNTQWIDNFAQQLKHDVKLGATLAKGKAVYVSSANGTNMIVSAASNASEATSSKTLGLLETGGATNDIVKVITEGLLAGLDTSTATAGDPVWLGTNGDLIFGLANKPVAPAHLVFIGVVTRVQSVNGEIFVKVQNGFELNEIHNVLLSSTANNDGLFYESSSGLWKNKSIATVLGYTPANGANYLPLTGGTLTGGLYINPANSSTVGLDLATNTFRLRTDTSQPFPRQLTTTIGSGTLVKMQAAGYGATYVTDLGFYTSSGSAVNTTPNLYLTGGNNRVGINTDTPAYTLDVSGTIGASGAITANSFVKASGTSAQFLMADGSVSLGATATARTEQIFTATSGQTTFTVTGGYVVGLVDVYVNGVKLLPSDFTATNGSTVVLGTGAVLNDSVTIINYTATIAALPTSRDVIDYTATSAQTTFTVTGGYVVGLLDVYVNGVKLTSSEYTATNGTTFVLTVASVSGDQVQAIRYNASVNGVSGSGTANYLPKFTASQTLGNSLIQDDGTTVTIGSTDSNLLMPRAATSNNATVNFATGGTVKWNVGLRGLYSADDFYIFNPVLGINYITLSAASSLANFGVSIRAQTFTSYIASGIFLNNSSGGTSAVQMRINNTGGDFRAGIESSAGGTIQLGTSAYAAVFGNQANYATQFTTNGTVRMTIDATGNVGVGVIPSAWGSPFVVTEYPYGSYVGGTTTGGTVLGNNNYYNGTSYIYKNSDYATQYSMSGGNHTFRVASTGTAGNVITWTPAMTILSGGYVGIGTASPSQILHIAGPSNNVFLNEATSGNYAINRLKNSTYTVDVGVDASGLYLDGSTGATRFYAGASQRMIITTFGNLGIGTTTVPNAYPGSYGLQVGTTATLVNIADQSYLMNNWYYGSGGSATYIKTGYAQRFLMASDGSFIFTNTPSGSANATITTEYERMKIDPSGRIIGKVSGTNGQLQLFQSDSSYNTDAMMYLFNNRNATSSYNFAKFFSGYPDNTQDIEFNFRGDGTGFSDGGWTTPAADYAEYFESLDGTALTVGSTVVLENGKIRLATESDTNIIGAIRPKNASLFLGNNAEHKWNQKYLKDDFGAYILDEEGMRTLNPEYDSSVEYVSREKRDEWNIVGLVGQVPILKSQPVGSNWVKMYDVSSTVEMWLIK